MRACVGLMILCGIALLPELAMSRSSGAPAGFAGDVVDNGVARTCTVCHSGNAVNDAQGGGSVTIEAPDSAAPGETIDITVVLVNNTPETSSGRRQGFSATVKDPATDTFIGSYVIPDPAMVQLTSNNDAYVTHTTAGNSQLTWSFQWTVPSTGVPSEVVIYTAGNAANGQGQGGDFIYTDTHTVSLASVASEEGPRDEIGVAWAPIFPNPVRDDARVELVLAESMDIAVRLVDGRGRIVRELASGVRSVGTHRIDLEVAGIAPGTYFLVAETEAGQRTQAVSVVR